MLLKAEDRLLFKDAMKKIGLDMTQSQLVNNIEDGLAFANRIGYPIILRPSFTMGGSGEAGLPITARSLLKSSSAVSISHPFTKSLLKKACLVGRSLKWR